MAGGHHVLTVVSGFGLRVIPYAPYRISHGPGPRELDIDHDSPTGPRFAQIVGRLAFTAQAPPAGRAAASAALTEVVDSVVWADRP